MAALVLLTPGQSATAEDTTSPVVIELGNQSVSLSEFDQLFNVAIRLLATQQGLAFGDQKPEQLAMLRQQYLNQRANEMALIEEANRRNIDVSDEDVHDQFSEFVSRFSADASTRAVVDQTLLRQLLREKQQVTLLSAQLLKEIEVRPGEVVVMHHDVEEQLATPEQACLRHIVVTDSETAVKLRRDLEQDADFAELARNNSIDEASAANGGDLGCVAKEHIVPQSDFERAVFNTKVGILAGPVSSDAGYHLLVVYDRKSARTPTLNEVYNDLEKEIRHERLPEKLVQIRDASGVVTWPDRLVQ
jgi:peptidyl-prolyl cis-trans isomerase C